MISQKLTKPDKLGIHADILQQTIDILSKAVEAAFTTKLLKKNILEIMRFKIEVLKHLIRTENELEIIDRRTYIRISEQLVEISKMTSGWLEYITQKESL